MEELVVYAIPAFVLLIAIEWLGTRSRAKPVYTLKDTAACLAMGLGNVIMQVLARYTGDHLASVHRFTLDQGYRFNPPGKGHRN